MYYLKCEYDRKRGDGMNPVPYYFLSILGDDYKKIDNKKDLQYRIFQDKYILQIYKLYKRITINYLTLALKEKSIDGNYNKLIKLKMLPKIIEDQFALVQDGDGLRLLDESK